MLPFTRLLKLVCDHVLSVVVLSCPRKGRRATGQEQAQCQMTSALPRPASAGLHVYGPSSNPQRSHPSELTPKRRSKQPISVGSLLLSISGSDKYALRLKLTFKALEKLKILLGSYEH